MSILINDPVLSVIWTQIQAEIERAAAKHPRYPTDPLRRTAIMVEEAGEAIQAALDLTRDWAINTTGLTSEQTADKMRRIVDDARYKLFDETVQTAAMAIRLLVAMVNDREPGRDKILS